MERPQKPYFDLFLERGIHYEQVDNILTVQGELEPGEFSLPGDVSSQFVTGLLYALHFMERDSRILLTTPLESAGYVRMTLEVLSAFGVEIENRDFREFLVPGEQFCQARDLTMEGDWSQAAFWYAAKALGSPVEIAGLREDSSQGDRVVRDLFPRLCREEGEVELDLSG